MDRISPQARSRNMRHIRSRDTGPELVVRRFLHREGLRFRLHRRDLPGTPDLTFARARIVVFVHGCFWHGCPSCRHGQRKVGTNVEYWTRKIARNNARDLANRAALKADGWQVLIVWECETKHDSRLKAITRQIRARIELPSSVATRSPPPHPTASHSASPR